jgi:PKD repeat protein
MRPRTVPARLRSAIAALTCATTVAGFVLMSGVPASADPGGVVISELNYHAGSDLDTDDYLELTNTGSTPIDMSGWSFTAGVTATFPAGTSIAAGQRFVVAKDATQFATTYGFAPDAVYGGNLSNGGETVTIVDASATVVDTVTYSDSAPWPTSPDGTGPSLELRDLTSDNTLPDSWSASLVPGGTPGTVNSTAGSGAIPVVTDPTVSPARPAPGDPIAVSARLRPGSTASLTYTVMFDAAVSVPFLDDAASPGGAGDGVYGATIPGQSAGKLVRYRIDAVSGTTKYSEPSADDSVHYRGVVVTNPAVSTKLPVIEWFMDDGVYADLLANHRQDDVTGAAVWSYDGTVIDGVEMSIRGNSSRTDTKVNWKVQLPKGYTFDLGGRLPYPLDEFALQNYSDEFADVSWATVKGAGDRALNIVPVRTQRNGAFWSLGRIMETEDGRWRDAQGVSDWAIYKGDAGALAKTASPAALEASGNLEKKSRKDEDFSDAWTLTNAIDAPASAAQEAWIYQNVNVPELVNYMAINSIIRHQDSGWYNWWIARDTDGTGRWEMWQWDLNWTFTTPQSDGKGLFLTPDTSNRFTTAMLQYPDIRAMFFRRLRTLADQYLAPGRYEAMWDAIAAQTTPDWNLDHTKWGGYTPASARTAFIAGLADRRNAIADNTGAGKPVPASQAADASVVLDEIQYHPGGTGGEYIELANPSSTAVDLSGWTIDAVGLTIQPGTVIPAGGRIVFVSDDTAFRAAYTGAGRLVGGEFTGSLDDSGEAVVLKDGSRAVDSVTYSNQAPWPTAADGSGPSLELDSLTADNADPASWSANSTTGGTPGLPNTVSAPSNAAPTAAFRSTVSGLEVDVDGSGSKDSDGTVKSYAWQFGDGATATGATASHTYSTEGDHTVTLTVTDDGGATATVTHTVTVTAPPPPASGTLAADAFSRTVSGGLGTADTGGAWTTSGTASSFAVTGGAATIASPSGANRFAYLGSVSSSDTDLTATIGLTRPRASSLYAGLIGRRLGTATYAARIVVSSSGTAQVQLQRNTDTVLKSATLSGGTIGTGDQMRLRLQVTGASPTTVRAKAWKVGTPEPTTWQVTTTDATSGLQSAGSIGLYSYLCSTGRPSPITVTFDDITATTGQPAPSNTAPSAAFTSTVTGLKVDVDGSGSSDSDGTVKSYAWQFGDGATASGATASHTYAAAGDHTVTLTVTDDAGATGTITHTVTVSAPPPPPSTGAFAADAFSRTVSGGLGTADAGGAWTTSGTAGDFAVAGGTATISSPTGSNRFAYLGSVSSSDTDVTATIGLTRPTASSLYAGLVGRRIGTSSYGARIVVSSTGTAQLQLQRNTDTVLKSAELSGLTVGSGDRIQLRLEVTGTSPTTIRTKAWKVGTPEPAAWQVTTTDSTAGLQAAGSIGLYSYLSSTGRPTPIVVTFDDLTATTTQ